ncbi:MAG: S1 RNA-binding domain-containing protein [Anaerolineae bacterium]|nr:MAG: S1 RNA-binding domain-containing protein [Anaerolineae bacterium]
MALTNENVQELKPKTKLRGKIIKTSLAGAIVDVGQDLPGVIHISQLRKEPVNKVEDVVQVGQEVDVWVRRVRKDRIELTMIEPLPLEWREIKPNMVVKGKVVRLESYGAFVDIGAERPGLIHVSELAHGYIKSPDEVVREGDEVEAMVLEVNRRKKRIRLSMKALQPEPSKKETKEKSGNRRSEVEEEHDAEPEMTVMEIAWREALERARARRKESKKATEKAPTSEEQEEILSRTLEQRVPTG